MAKTFAEYMASLSAAKDLPAGGSDGTSTTNNNEVPGAPRGPKTFAQYMAEVNQKEGRVPKDGTPAVDPNDPFAGENWLSTLNRKAESFVGNAVKMPGMVLRGFAEIPPSDGSVPSVDLEQKFNRAIARPKLDEEMAGIDEKLKNPNITDREKAQLQDRKLRIQDVYTNMDAVDKEDPKPRPVEESPFYKMGQAADKGAAAFFGEPDPRDLNTFSGKLAAGAGQMLGYAAGSAVGGGSMTALLGILTNADSGYQQAKAAGATEEQAQKAANFNGLIGVSEAIPIEHALKLLPAKLRGQVAATVGQRIQSLFISGGEEAVQEYFQQVAQNFDAAHISKYNPDQPLTDGAAQNALIGFILGGFVGAVGQTHNFGDPAENIPDKVPSPDIAPSNKGTPEVPIKGDESTIEGLVDTPQKAAISAAISPETTAKQPSGMGDSGPIGIEGDLPNAPIYDDTTLPEVSGVDADRIDSEFEPLGEGPNATPDQNDLVDLETIDWEAEPEATFTPKPILASEPVVPAPTVKKVTVAKPTPVPGKILTQDQMFDPQLNPGKHLASDMSSIGMTKIGEKAGSAAGGIYQDGNDVQYVVKAYKNPAQAHEEALAANLFNKAINNNYNHTLVPKMQVLDTPNMKGSGYLASNFIYGAQPMNKTSASQIKAIQDGFVANAWLANWDVVGMAYDNIIALPQNTVAYVDFGGALDFRAQGEPKGLKFTDKSVPEMETLRDHNMNPQTASIYGSITDEQIKKQVGNLVEVMYGNEQLFNTIYSTKLPGKIKIQLFTKLARRLYHLAEKYTPDVAAKMDADTWISEGVDLLNKLDVEQKLTEALAKKASNETNNPPAPLIFDDHMKQQLAMVENAAESYAVLNNNLNESLSDGIDLIGNMIKSPEFMALIYNENYHKWAKGNKIWWNAMTNRLMWYENTEGLTPLELASKHYLLPPLLFHGVKTHLATPVYNQVTGSWEVINQWDMKKTGQGVGGGDTTLGAFLTDSVLTASNLTSYELSQKIQANLKNPDQSNLDISRLGKNNVQPFVVNLDPLIFDFKGHSWSASKSHKLAAVAKSKGHNSLMMINIKDMGTTHAQIIVFSPDGKHMKSPFSVAFDGENNLYVASKLDPKKVTNVVTDGREFTMVGLPAIVIEQLRKALKVFGLDGLVDLRVFQFNHSAQIAANFEVTREGLFIGLASELPSDVSWDGQFHHEVIHALRYLGFFRSAEGQRMWQVLVNKVNDMGGISDEVKNNYPKKFWMEEQVARLMSLHRDGKFSAAKESLLNKTLTRVKNLWEAFRNWAKGLGFRTAEQTFDYLTSGALSDRAWMQAADMSAEALDIQSMYKVASKLGIKTSKKAKQGVDYYNKLVKWGWHVIQLAKKNPHIQFLQEYTQHAHQWHNKKSQWLAMANETVAKWNKLSIQQHEALSAAIFEITETVNYADPTVVDRGKLSRDEADILMKHGLTRSDVELYIQIRSDFRKMLNEIERVTMENIVNSMPNNPLGAMIEQAKAQKEFKQLKKNPYFPHTRFGNYTIIVKDGSGKTIHMEAYESIKARDKAVAEVEALYPNDTVSTSMLSEEMQVYRGIPQSFLVAMRNNMKLTQKQQKILEDMIVHAGPAMSFKNHMTKKENIAGFSRDALRSYAEYFWHGANHVARIEYGPMMEADIANGEASIRQMIKTGVDSTKRRQIVDYLLHHYKTIMTPQEDWAGMRHFGFTWHLAFNVKSAVMNLFQVPMVTYSHLAAHFGDVQSIAAIGKAGKNMNAVFRTPDKAIGKMTPQEIKFIGQAIKDGFMDESFSAELAGIAEGSSLVKFGLAKTATRKAILTFNHLGGWMFQTAEKINRRLTFLAAVDLALKNPNAAYLQNVMTRFALEHQKLTTEHGFTNEEALAYLVGKDTVESTQGNYQAWARPRIMEGRKSAFLTFFMFTQNMMWFIHNSPGNVRFILLMLLLAGLQGLPFEDDLEEIIKATGQLMFGKEWDMEKELREILVELMPDAPPDLFLHGLSRYGFGLPQIGDMIGLPIPSVDMSGSLGMGSPLPIISPTIQGLTSLAQGNDFDTVASKFTNDALGPSLGVPVNILKAMADSQMAFTDPKRWESAMPAALANISKAARFYREGEERTRTGAQVIPFDTADPHNLGEIIAQAGGFRPTRLTEQWDKIAMQRDAAHFWETRRNLLKNGWDRAVESRDPEERKKILQAVRRYNTTVPYRALRLELKDLEKSRKAKERRRKNFEQGLPDAKMMRGVYEDVGKLFPTTEYEDVKKGK